MPSRFLLVVDTSPVSWQRVSRALPGTAGFAMSARTIAEAEAAARAGEIALVIGSMRVPDGGGYELARRVRAVRPEVRVLLLADGPDRYDPVQGAAAGVSGLLDWPCPVDRLRERLEEALSSVDDDEGIPAATLPAASADAADTLPEPRFARFAAAPEPVAAPSEATALGFDDVSPLDPAQLESVPLDAISALENTPIEPIPPATEPIHEVRGAIPVEPAWQERAAPPEPRTAPGDERLATFLPRDWKTYAPVRVDPSVVQPAMERAILEVLPEVVDTVLRRLLATSPALRELVEVAVDEAVRAQVGPIARSVIRERLAEIEAAADDGS